MTLSRPRLLSVPVLTGAVQVDPELTALAFRDFQLLKLKHDELLSNFAFNFNLRHYNMDTLAGFRKPAYARVPTIGHIPMSVASRGVNRNVLASRSFSQGGIAGLLTGGQVGGGAS